MLEVQVQVESRFDRVATAVARETPEFLRRESERLENIAKGLIETSDQPSTPGSPPHTRGGDPNLRDAIQSSDATDEVLVGPAASVVGEVGEALEFGGVFKDTSLAARPFMGPALDEFIPGFAGGLADSIGE